MGTLPPNSYKNAQRADPTKEWSGNPDYEFYGEPDGPLVKYPLMGEVGTFTQKRADMRLPKDSGTVWLMHHVPRNCRGKYKLLDEYIEEYNEFCASLAEGEIGLSGHEVGPPEQWMDYERELKDFRVDELDWVLCDGFTKSGQECKRKAVNLSGYCEAHGGKLHPLDKVVDIRRDVATPKASKYNNEEVQKRMTRYQQFISGLITVKDLDDEELAKGQFRGRDGKFAGNPPKQIPREMHDQFVNELFERADIRLKEGLVACVDTMVEVASSPVYEAKDRIKAAQWVFERVRGKSPEVIVHQQDKPWEHVFQKVVGGSREESRAARQVVDAEWSEDVGVDSQTLALAAEGVEIEWEDDEDLGDEYDDTFGLGDPDGPISAHEPGTPGGTPVFRNSRNAPKAQVSEEESQYEYRSISLVGDDGEDYDKVIATPKKGSKAEAMAKDRKAHEKKRKAALKALKAKQLAEGED